MGAREGQHIMTPLWDVQPVLAAAAYARPLETLAVAVHGLGCVAMRTLTQMLDVCCAVLCCAVLCICVSLLLPSFLPAAIPQHAAG